MTRRPRILDLGRIPPQPAAEGFLRRYGWVLVDLAIRLATAAFLAWLVAQILLGLAPA